MDFEPADAAGAPAAAQALAARFAARFDGARPSALWQAPGRINIIGEHVDHSGGPVLPAAIDRRCRVAIGPAADGHMTAVSEFGQARIPLDRFARRGDWSDYAAGMAFALMEAGHRVAGCRMLIDSDVPAGGGVSSSAALQVATGLALTGGSVTGADLARIAQRSENVFVGAPCGIMDMYASACGQVGAALHLDCATLACTPVPVPDHAAFIVVASGASHRLVDGGYAARLADCAEASRALGVGLLAEAAVDSEAALARLSGRPARRARHVFSEIARVGGARAALEAGDLVALGRLMDASHQSLARDFEVSTPELDALAERARAIDGVHGARMMGGGFGGSVIALADSHRAAAACAALVSAHSDWLGRQTSGFVARIAGGAGALEDA